MPRKSTDLAKLQTAIGYRFSDESVLRAFLDTPYTTRRQAEGKTWRNAEQDRFQREEWLGDQVLHMGIDRILVDDFPGLAPREHKHLYAALSTGEAAGMVADHIRLLDYMDVPEYSDSGGHFARDAVEALLGAIFMDATKRGADAAVDGAVRQMFAPLWLNLQESHLGPLKDSKHRVEFIQNMQALSKWRGEWVQKCNQPTRRLEPPQQGENDITLNFAPKKDGEQIYWQVAIGLPLPHASGVSQKYETVMGSGSGLADAMVKATRRSLRFVEQKFNWKPDPATLATPEQIAAQHPGFLKEEVAR